MKGFKRFDTGNKVVDIILYVLCCGVIIDSIMGIILSIKKWRKAKADRIKAEAELKELKEKFENHVQELVNKYNELLEENELLKERNTELYEKIIKYEIENRINTEEDGDILVEGTQLINKANKMLKEIEVE